MVEEFEGSDKSTRKVYAEAFMMVKNVLRCKPRERRAFKIAEQTLIRDPLLNSSPENNESRAIGHGSKLVVRPGRRAAQGIPAVRRNHVVTANLACCDTLRDARLMR